MSVVLLNGFEEWLNSFMTGPLSYRSQSIDLQSKSMDWFLYNNGLRREEVNYKSNANNLASIPVDPRSKVT